MDIIYSDFDKNNEGKILVFSQTHDEYTLNKIKIDISKLNKFLEISNDINLLHIDDKYAMEKALKTE